MGLDFLRLVEHVHGHLGWLAAALLVHPALVLRRPDRRAHVAVGLATSLVTLGAGIGIWLYGGYRTHLKQQIFVASPRVGFLFERKEHLALGAVLLAWAGCAAYVAADRAKPPVRLPLRMFAWRAFAASAALAIVVAVLGTVVAVFRTF